MSEQKDIKWAVRHTGGATYVYAPTREKAIAKWKSMYGKTSKLESITNAADRRALKKAASLPDANVITQAEAARIMAITPHYKWRSTGGKLLMDFGTEGHRDRIRKVNGRIEYKRHVHSTPAYSDLLGHPNYGKMYIRYDVLVYLSIDAFANDDVFEFIEGKAKTTIR